MAKDKSPAKDKKDEKPKEETPAEGGAAPAKKSPIKLILAVVVVLLLEGGTVLVTMMLSGGPKKVEAHAPVTDEKAKEDALVEILVVKDRFPNQRTGRTYLYDTEIYITVKSKDGDKIREKVEMSQAQLSTEIATIFRRAEPAQLLEPTMATLTRQIKASLDERLGKDAEGQPVVQGAFVKKCIQFRTDI